MLKCQCKNPFLFGALFLLLLNACGNVDSQNNSNPISETLPTETSNEEENPYSGSNVVNPADESVVMDSPSFEESVDSCVSELVDPRQGYMIDARDNRIYNTVTIGCQTWMAENLNLGISQLNFPPYIWYYEEQICDSDNCSGFVRYRYYTQLGATTSCPEGWHLPTNKEWEILFNALGSNPFAMQSVGYEGWPYATNASLFSAIPAGFYNNFVNTNIVVPGFNGVGTSAVFWSATREMGDMYYNLSIDGNSVNFGVSYKNNYNSVRCVKEAYSNLIDPRDGKFYNVVTIGSQTWMAENLNYAMPDSYCNYDSCKVLGRYYTRNAAMEACPEGRHLPDNTEWETLYQYLDGHYDALLLEGYIVISKTMGFSVAPYPTYPSDASGFSALLAGNCSYGHCGNSDTKPYATFWSSSENSYWAIDVNGASIFPSYSGDALSVRCLMNP